ncbi:MAG: NAD(+)/NADH kinase [Pirellulaceae bacterium]|nr:NAD(+)/NADH kinase [Pirellulaceae bacterium]
MNESRQEPSNALAAANRRPSVMLLGSDQSSVKAALSRIRPILAEHATIVLEDFTFQQDLKSIEADFALVLGGDGTILRSARQMGIRQRPVLGVNLGKLGFLADLSVDALIKVFADVCAGKFSVIDHLMLACRVERDGQPIIDRLGLNEVAVLGGPPYSIMDVDLYVDAELVTTYSCDGLIISTPVGSTAHSLSAGGPILRKNLQAFVVSPISPHTLTVRPVVDTADRVYEMVVKEPNADTSVVVDGEMLQVLTPRDRVIVRRAEPQFQLIEVSGHSYYRTLRNKLGWGGRIQLVQDD